MSILQKDKDQSKRDVHKNNGFNVVISNAKDWDRGFIQDDGKIRNEDISECNMIIGMVNHSAFLNKTDRLKVLR